MSGGGKTQTTTQSNQIDPALKEILLKLYGTGENMLGPWLNTPNYRVAGFTPDQISAMDMTRGLGDKASAMSFKPVTSGAVSTAEGQQLGPGEINQFMNPYTDLVIDKALGGLRSEVEKSKANLGAQIAAGGSYGGSREVLGKVALEDAHAKQAGQLYANLLSQGFDKSAALASTNAQMRQQTELANAQTKNNFALQSANMANQYGLASNQNDWSRQLQALQALLQSGAMQQALAQKAIDIPTDALKTLMGVVPGNLGSTTTTTAPDNSPSPIMQILGMAANVAGAYAKSDENTKTNVRKLGKDPQTGLPLYEYDDKGDIEAARKSGKPMPPKRVSVMAQDVEKIAPDMVRKVGGTRIIKRA